VSWAWLALAPADTAGRGDLRAPDLGAAVHADDEPGSGLRLSAWWAGPRPYDDAVRVDAAALDASGARASVVWQWFPRDRAPLFDDPAVQELTRRLAERDLAGHLPAAVSTFTRDPVHYVGGLTVHRDDRSLAALTRDSWLHRVGPVRGLRIGAGLLGATNPRPGPGTQRYAGQPWPATRFTS